MTVPHFEGDPVKKEYWEERGDQLQFLNKKLNWQRDQIREKLEEFPEFVKQWQKQEGIERNAKKKMLEKLDPQEVPKGGQLYHEVLLDKVEHPLSYLLESYMIERKRSVEQGLKVIRDSVNPNKVGDSFSLGTFINSLDEYQKSSLEPESWQIQTLRADPTFMHKMIEMKDFLIDVRKTRNRLSHYQAEVKKDIEIKFKVGERKRNQIIIKEIDSADEFDAKIKGMEIPEFLDKEEETFDKFTHQIQVTFNKINRLINVRRFLQTHDMKFLPLEELED